MPLRAWEHSVVAAEGELVGRDERWENTNRVEGTVSGPTVQAGSIQGGVHVHLHLDEFDRNSSSAEGNPAPSCGNPRLGDLPPEVRSLLRAQVQAATELPYRLPGARRPSLATVYVRQELGAGAETTQPEQPSPAPMLDDRGRIVDVSRAWNARVVVRPPARAVREVLDSDRHLVITGGPGQGKSTLSLRLAADIAEQWTVSGDVAAPLPDAVVPLRLTARELAARLDLPFAEALAASARVEYGALLSVPLTGSALNDRVLGCPWLLLVDGLDEVAGSGERDRLVSVLAAWASSSPDSAYRVVVTTRPIEGAALAPLQRIGAARYELQPFDDEALRRFAENWFAEVGPERAQHFLRDVRDAHLDELVSVPLLATITYEQSDGQPLPDNQYELYDAYLAFLGAARTCALRPFGRRRAALLEHLGLVRLERDTSLVEAARDWALRNVPAPELADGWEAQLRVFLASTGPLVVRGGDLAFLHHSFAEHLAATATARTLPEQFDPDDDGFANLLHSALPKDAGRHARAVLLHYARLRPDQADPLMSRLHAGSSDQHLLAARLLARHIPAGADTTDAFMATARGWAMTTQYAAGEILRQTCRAVHHPGLVEWLLDLMRTNDAPWPSRVEAASALAIRVRSTHSSEATALLRTVADDDGVPIDHRLAAAEALAHSGTAERDTAERGLRSVLRDPLASGKNCRTAAIVLSAFGARARADAVKTLSRLLADPDTPTDDIVAAATGLVEIGTEFHEPCAEVFRAVLRDPVDRDSMAGRRDAALGLASLGPQCLADAATEITALITDRRRHRFDRATAANILSELGPQHRIAAGKLLTEILGERGIMPFERQTCAYQLAQLGAEFKLRSVAELRSVITDPEANTNNILFAARYLAEISPELQSEAADTMWKLLDDPAANGDDRAQTLGELARLTSDPHRQQALDRLRAIASDCAADPWARFRAAQLLADIGPEFHAEACSHLRALAASGLDSEIVSRAWRELLMLDASVHDQACEALLDLASSEGPAGALSLHVASAVASTDRKHVEQVARALNAVQTSEERSLRARISATRELVALGRTFHRGAAGALCELLRSPTNVDVNLTAAVQSFTATGTGIRAEVGEALRDLILNPHSSSEEKWDATEALAMLGDRTRHETATVLQCIARDESADFRVRTDAALALARMNPGFLAEARETVFQMRSESWRPGWRAAVLDLAELGAEVVPQLQAVAGDRDVDITARSAAAALLAALAPDSADKVRAELQRWVDDDHLAFDTRSDIWQVLVELDHALREPAARYHQQVIEDEQENIAHRAAAAYLLAQLNRGGKRLAIDFLRRNAEDPRMPSNARRASAAWLDNLLSWRYELNPLLIAVVQDPWTEPYDRLRLAERLPRKVRTEIERALLADRSAAIEDRLPQRDVWGDLPLAAEAETEVRDVLAAVESLPSERVSAAAALARLSRRHLPEGIRLLNRFAQQEHAAYQARKELAAFGPSVRREVQDWAENQLRNETLPLRDRLRAARLAMDITTDLPDSVVHLMRQVAQDERSSDRDRVDAVFALGHIDGLDRLRALRDDLRQTPVVRWRAAEKLLDRTVEDRASGLQLLHGIAADVAVRPALRRFVAGTLATLGVPGRERAVTVLRGLMHDTTVATAVRAEAAQALADLLPSGHREVLSALHGMRAEAPLCRRKILLATATIDPVTAEAALSAMARDEGLGGVVRVRCAEALVALRRDWRERAAGVARAVARDETAPSHVRRHAARDLARWSELCRDEARAMIRDLNPLADEQS